MKELNLAKVINRYNSIMNDLCYEHNTISTGLSETTGNWNLRDMVAECDYLLSTFYEEGHANNEGQYDESEEIRKAWGSSTRRLRNFIKAYEPYIKGMKCTEGHCSRFD